MNENTAAVSGAQQVHSMRPPRKGKKTAFFIALGLLLALGIAIAAGFYTGWLYGGTKTPEQQIQLAYKVCKTEDIEKYNKLKLPLDTDSQKTMDSLASDISKRAHVGDDATCQTILFFAAFTNKQTNKMQAYLDNIKRLHAMGLSRDSELLVDYTISAMEYLLIDLQSELNVTKDK
jgi:hypothetical protein